jgi:predicted transcriptional regulator
MREILTISVDHALKTKLNKTAKKLHVTRSELVKRAIEKYIVKEEIIDIRNILIPYAEKAGYYTDDDVFNDIS